MAEVSDDKAKEAEALYEEGCAFEGAAVVALVHNDSEAKEDVDANAEPTAMEIMMEDGVLMTVELDSGEKRLAELGYKQDLRRALVRLPSESESSRKCSLAGHFCGRDICISWSSGRPIDESLFLAGHPVKHLPFPTILPFPLPSK